VFAVDEGDLQLYPIRKRGDVVYILSYRFFYLYLVLFHLLAFILDIGV